MLMWGVGLFVAGQASVLATTYAGQALMDGCLRVRLPAMTRVTLSRLISIGPAVAVAIWTVTVIPTLTLTRALTLTLTLPLLQPLPLPLPLPLTLPLTRMQGSFFLPAARLACVLRRIEKRLTLTLTLTPTCLRRSRSSPSMLTS